MAPTTRWVLVIAWCCAALACGGGADETSPATGTVSLQTADSPLVTFRIAFRTGSIDDPEGKHGLNALTARMLGSGGTTALTYEALTKTLYPWAASIGAQFDKELTTIVADVHRDHLDPFYAILRDLIVRPRFDPEDFKRNQEFLKNTVVATLRGSDDEELGKQSLGVLLYGGHPYEATQYGTEEGLNAITLDDVKAFHQAHYTKENLLLGLAGGYPDGFLERVEQDLAAALPSGGGQAAALPAPRSLQGLEVLLVDKEAIATAISIGYPIGVTRADADFYPLLVANSYLGEHRTFNGRLMNQMRGLRGLNYGDYSYIENFIQDGGTRFPVPNIPRRQQFFSIWIRPVPHHNAHFALRQAIGELKRLVDEGLTEKQFEATRAFLLNYSKLYVQTTSRRLGYLMDSQFYGTDYVIDELQRRLEGMTRDEVNAAIKKHLQYENLGVAIVTSDADAFKTKLLAGEPSPPTYNAAVSEAIKAEDQEIQTFPLAINAERVRVVPVEEMFKTVGQESGARR